MDNSAIKVAGVWEILPCPHWDTGTRSWKLDLLIVQVLILGFFKIYFYLFLIFGRVTYIDFSVWLMVVCHWQQDMGLGYDVSSDVKVQNLEATGWRDTKIKDLLWGPLADHSAAHTRWGQASHVVLGGTGCYRCLVLRMGNPGSPSWHNVWVWGLGINDLTAPEVTHCNLEILSCSPHFKKNYYYHLWLITSKVKVKK